MTGKSIEWQLLRIWLLQIILLEAWIFLKVAYTLTSFTMFMRKSNSDMAYVSGVCIQTLITSLSHKIDNSKYYWYYSRTNCKFKLCALACIQFLNCMTMNIAIIGQQLFNQITFGSKVLYSIKNIFEQILRRKCISYGQWMLILFVIPKDCSYNLTFCSFLFILGELSYIYYIFFVSFCWFIFTLTNTT